MVLCGLMGAKFDLWKSGIVGLNDFLSEIFFTPEEPSVVISATGPLVALEM